MLSLNWLTLFIPLYKRYIPSNNYILHNVSHRLFIFLINHTTSKKEYISGTSNNNLDIINTNGVEIYRNEFNN